MKRLVALLLLTAAAAQPARAVEVVPANDAFENASSIESLPFTAVRDVLLATQEIGEPLCSANGHTTWYSYTPAVPTSVRIEASAGWAGVYRGTSVDELNQIGCTYAYYPIDIELAAGKTYMIQLDAATSGTADLSIRELGAISGLVRGPDGGPAGGLCVQAYAGDDLGVATVATTQSDGTFELADLEPGAYDVWIGCDQGPFGSLWYGGALERAAATPVIVSGGATTSGIDTTLPAPTAITGTVRTLEGESAVGCAVAYRTDGTASFRATLLDAGYRIYVTPGTYKVAFEACYSAFMVDEWYDDASTFDDATPVTVDAGQVASGIDAEVVGFRYAPNDYRQAAEPIGVFPYRTHSFAPLADRFDNDPAQCEGNQSRLSVWYRYTPAETTTVVAAIDTDEFYDLSLLDVYVMDGGSLVKVSCSNEAYGIDRLAFVAEAGRTYYIQHGASSYFRGVVPLVFDETTDPTSHTVEPMIPCGIACFPLAGWYACTPGLVPGMYRDVPVEVPALAAGAVPADMAVHVSSSGEVDAMLCRDDGEMMPAVAHGWAVSSSDCDIIGCDETFAVPVVPGERYVVRVFNVASVGPADVTISYRRDR